MAPTFLTAKIWQSYILEGDLLQEGRALAARVTCHNLSAPQPITKPRQPTVAVEGVGQEVSEAMIEQKGFRAIRPEMPEQNYIQQRVLQSRESLQRVKGPRSNGGQMVVV